MIAHLKGKLANKSPDHSIVDVNGVGYKVFTPLSTYYALPKPGESVSLLIYTRVREDELKLFGFLTEVEQTTFEKLITINNPSLSSHFGALFRRFSRTSSSLLTAIRNA